MSIIDGLLIFFAILFTYLLVVIILHKKGILKKYNISFYGPALLLRTKKGTNFLQKIANKKRFWKAYGSFGVVFSFIVMIFMVTIFIWQTWMLFGLNLTPEQKANLPGPEVALILPGINPILPLEYIGFIILALAIAIVVHEFSHGILTFVGKLKVKSLGILYLILPIGAFCEPDEEELKKTETAKRMRIYAAGPLSNFVAAFIFLLIFSFVFMSAVQPIDGADILYVYDDTPAKEIGLSMGAVITSVNDTEIKNIDNFRDAIDNTMPNQTVNITYVFNGDIVNKQVKFISLYDFYNGITDEEINESFKNISFLGIGFNAYSGGYIQSLKNPITYDFPNGFIRLYALPIVGYIDGYNPIASPFTDSYKITGPFSAIPSNVFWMITTALYWIFWLNLLVGLFNVLPMVPLDGGFLFNDALRSFVKKVKKDISDEMRDKIVKNVSLVISLTILFLVIFPFFIKYL